MVTPRQGRPAFRLVELGLALVCVVVALGLISPATRQVRDAAARTQCANNLKQLLLAVHNYAGAHGDELPALSSDLLRPEYGEYNGGIFVTILPFLEQDVLYQSATNLTDDYTAATWSAPIPPSLTAPPALRSQPVKVYQCPADATMSLGMSGNQAAQPDAWAASSYAANYQVFGTVNDLSTTDTPGPKFGNACAPKYHLGKIPDGTSSTVFFGEQFSACGPKAGNLWAYPGIGNYSDTKFYPVTPKGNGIVNTPASTNSLLWAPVFANSHRRYGFAAGGSGGSIYRHNALASPATRIEAPYADGQYWDAPPQNRPAPTECDKSRLQLFHVPGVGTVGLGDGSVRTITAFVSQATWYAVLVPDDGTPFDSTW